MTKNKECAGTYPVSGYTRSDGTKVDSYTRTCGAKHLGSPTGAAAGLTDKEKEEVITKNLEDYAKYCSSLAQLQEFVAKNNNIFFSCFKYYKLALDYDNQKYWNNDNYYDKFKDMPVCPTKDFIKNMNIPGLNDYTDVVHPQINSPYNVRIVGDKIYGTLIDYYDFKNLKRQGEYYYTFINNNAYKQQEFGKLKNYLIVMPITLSIDNVK